MDVRSGYKQTEVGVIPADWDPAPVASMGQVITGKALAASAPGPQRPYLRTKNVFDGRIDVDDVLTMPMTDQQFSQFRLRNGDVLLNEGQSLELVGRCAIYRDEYPEPCAIQNQLLRFRARPRVSGEFASHLFRYSQQTGVFARVALQTTSIAHLGGKRFESLALAWPRTEAEQRAIATALSDMDALLGGLNRLIAKKRNVKRAAMQQLVTGQIRLPSYHGEWKGKRLGDVAELNRLNVVPASQPNEPFVHFSLPAFDDGRAAQVELGATIASNKFRVPFNAVLVSKLNPRIPRIWAPEIVPENACASTEWLVLTPREGTERGFLFVLCSSPAFCEQMELAATGTTGSHQRISPNTALNIRVAVPIDQKEQIAVAAVLSDMDAELVALETRRDKTYNLKQAMAQQLLTGKTRLVPAVAAHA